MWADNFSKTHQNRSKLAQKIVIDEVVYSQNSEKKIAFPSG